MKNSTNYEALCDYIEDHSNSIPSYLYDIQRQAHLYMFDPHLLCPPTQGRLLALLSKLIQPNIILELGTFIGYSALCLAEGLKNEHATLFTVERNDELKNIIEQNFAKTPYKNNIHLIIDDASHFLQTNVIQHHSVDLIYIDADKRKYPEYLTLSLPLLQHNGLIIADNTLWAGHILDNEYDNDAQTKAIQQFNEQITQCAELETFILPAYDGITLARKK